MQVQNEQYQENIATVGPGIAGAINGIMLRFSLQNILA
jgi:hypothetical protein